MKNFRISFDFRKTVSVTENAEVRGDVIKRLLGYVASKCSTVWSLVAMAESVTWLWLKWSKSLIMLRALLFRHFLF